MISLLAFVVKRMLAMVVLVFVILTVVFVMAHASPYDPVRIMLGQRATTYNVRIIRHEFGLDKPELTQYWNYISGLAQGNLGLSESREHLGAPVWPLMQGRAPVTLKLGFWALLLSLLVGLPIGLISALRQNSIFDHVGQGTMVMLYVFPAFVICPLCQLLFGDVLHWLPVQGWGDTGWIGPLGLIPNPSSAGSPTGYSSLAEMVLPVTIYAAGLAGLFAKSFRSFMLEVLRQDYIRTARAKGLKERVVVYLHAMKNTLLPLASIIGPTIAYLIIGAFIVEFFFGIPGIAQDTVNSITNSDYALIEATTLMLAVFVIVVNMLTDIFYAAVDPRVRL
jgi:peptide/nickel transport system permease protein/oligopeptide transport system permease protein